jgi:hypothetical protein
MRTLRYKIISYLYATTRIIGFSSSNRSHFDGQEGKECRFLELKKAEVLEFTKWVNPIS